MNSKFGEIRRTDNICGGMYGCINIRFDSQNPLCKECLIDMEMAMEKALENTYHVEDTTTSIQQDHK